MNRINAISGMILLLGMTSIILNSCGKPQLAFPDDQDQQNYFTEGINYERQNFCPVDLSWPLEIKRDESINGTTTHFPGLIRDQVIFTTRNGYLTLVPLDNIGKDRKIRLSKGTTASPTIYKGKVYIPMEVGKYGLRVYDLESTKIEWELRGYYSLSAPVVWENLIIHTGKYGEILGLDAMTGKKIWQTDLGSNIFVNLAFNGVSAIAVSQDGVIQSIEPSYGLVNWSMELGKNIYAQPLLLKDHAYLPTYDGEIYALNLHTGDHDLIRSFNTRVYSPISTDLEHLYIPLSDGRIVCLEVASESDRWNTQLDGPVSVPILVTNKYLLIGTGQRKFYVLDKTTGEILQTIQLEGRLSSVPVISRNSVFIGYEYDHIALLKPQTE